MFLRKRRKKKIMSDVRRILVNGGVKSTSKSKGSGMNEKVLVIGAGGIGVS